MYSSTQETRVLTIGCAHIASVISTGAPCGAYPSCGSWDGLVNARNASRFAQVDYLHPTYGYAFKV